MIDPKPLNQHFVSKNSDTEIQIPAETTGTIVDFNKTKLPRNIIEKA